jgi:predicted secreted hydrolase
MTVRLALVLVLGVAGGVVQPTWREASPDYRIALPRDHASHPAYRIEWWYYTGHLADRDGRRFGYQVTFFRIGVDPAPENPSVWAVRDLHMAHAAVTDVDGGNHLFAERLNRVGVGWAGAAADAYHVWNEDWEVRLVDGRHELAVSEDDFALTLSLAESTVILHGHQGYSQKGSTPGNASHYYSLTRMATRGTLRIAGETFEVTGNSWMDHEFGTSFLERTQQGWDWFSLQLDTGVDVMLFQLRGKDGSVDPRSSGTVAESSGRTRALASSDFSLAPGRIWTSSETAGRYPIEWRIAVPREGLELEIIPLLDAQELLTPRSGVSYWEGAVMVRGRQQGRPVAGQGYLEMTGYAGEAMGEALGRPVDR